MCVSKINIRVFAFFSVSWDFLLCYSNRGDEVSMWDFKKIAFLVEKLFFLFGWGSYNCPKMVLKLSEIIPLPPPSPSQARLNTSATRHFFLLNMFLMMFEVVSWYRRKKQYINKDYHIMFIFVLCNYSLVCKLEHI